MEKQNKAALPRILVLMSAYNGEKYLPEQVYRKGTQPASKSDKKETTALRSKK